MYIAGFSSQCEHGVPTVDVNGIELHYLDSGTGPVVLLIHGLGTGSADWERQLPALSTRYRVIAPCLRGFGNSARPPGAYSIAVLAEDIVALLERLDIATVHLCGLSMGGAVAFEIAVRWPERLESLVLINSQPSFAIDSFKKRMLFYSRKWLARIVGLDALARFQARRNFPGADNAALRASLRGRYRNSLQPYLQTLQAVGGWQVLDRLDRIRVPVLFIAAEYDYTSPQEKARFAAMLADARVVTISAARHAVHLERPEAVNAAMLGFLDEVEAATRAGRHRKQEN